jgi:hypothetical protein
VIVAVPQLGGSACSVPSIGTGGLQSQRLESAAASRYGASAFPPVPSIRTGTTSDRESNSLYSRL